jgi:hypothetical protein
MVDGHQRFARGLVQELDGWLLGGRVGEEVVEDWSLFLAQLLLHAQQSVVVDVFGVAAVLVLGRGVLVDLVVDEVVGHRGLPLLVEAVSKR